jgi:hypothetical protein
MQLLLKHELEYRVMRSWNWKYIITIIIKILDVLDWSKEEKKCKVDRNNEKGNYKN